MKNYVIKYALFSLPFFILICVELFILPIDFFTFRAWETLIRQRSYGLLQGPFYPGMTLVKTEEGGDLKPSPVCAVKKKDVVWQTDAYGYRKVPSSDSRYPIIIVGDSNAAGGGLSQDEMISEVLEKRLGKGVYPLAPESLKSIFKHHILKQTKPDVVILEMIERGIITGNFKIPRNADFHPSSCLEKIIWSIQMNPVLQSLAVKIDRVFKANGLQYLKARINSKEVNHHRGGATEPCPVLFLQGAYANRNIPDDIRLQIVQNIKHWSDFFTRKGIRFIFLPIPNKENIYHKQVGTPKPVFLEKLIRDLRDGGVEVVDTQKAFEEITQRKGVHLYHRDDTHWNAKGVEVAASLVADFLKTPPQRQ